jgi:hypothetical protein
MLMEKLGKRNRKQRGRRSRHRARGAGSRGKVRGGKPRGKRRGWLGGAGQRAAQVIVGIAMAAWKSGAAESEYGLDLGDRDAAAEQAARNPQIGDTPIGGEKRCGICKRWSQRAYTRLAPAGVREQGGGVRGEAEPAGGRRCGARVVSNRGVAPVARRGCAYSRMVQGAEPPGWRRIGFWLVNPASRPQWHQSALARSAL